MDRLKIYLLFFLSVIALSTISVSLGKSFTQGNKELEKVSLGIDVVVVVFDSSGLVNTTLIEKVVRDFSVDYACSGQNITIRYNITVLSAPRHLVEKLAKWFNVNYVDRGNPNWIEMYNISTQLHPIRWIRLENIVPFLYRLSISVLDYYKLSDYDAIIVVIGDVDGVSRQYYTEGRGGILTGVSGWAMTGPDGVFSFYDLTVAPRPRPEKHQPFYGLGIEVSPRTVQVIWKSENITRRVETLVKNHLITHLSGFCRNTATLNFNLDIHVVDYNESSAKILGNFSIDKLLLYLKSMAPWINFNISISIMKAEELGDLYYTTMNSTEENWTVLNWNHISRKLWDILDCNDRVGRKTNRRLIENYSYPIVVFATPQPSYFTMRVNRNYRINFTGISTICYSAISYPGYMGRVNKVGLESVIAHEVGHRLGLPHPFESPQDIIWEMDWAQTVMTYDDYAPPPFIMPGGVDGYARWRLSLAYTLMVLSSSNDSLARREILSYLERGEVYRALDVSLNHLLTTYGLKNTTTITVIETKTLKETITVTETAERVEEKTSEIILLILLLLLFTLLLSRS